MSKVRKILCIVLAFMMLVVPMSIGASAAPADGKQVALSLSTDTPTVKPGDTLVLKLTWDVDDFSRMWGLPCFYLMYDGSVFEPAADFKTNKTSLRQPMGDFGEYVVAANGVSNTITTTNYNAVVKNMSDADKAAYTTGVMMTFQVNNDAGYTVGAGFASTDAETVQCEFYLNIKEDAPLGTYKVGLPIEAYTANKAYFNCCDTGKAVRVAPAAIDTTNAAIEITVSNGEVAAPVLTKGRAQYKMETLVPGVSVADNFQYRVLSTISKADWEANFGNTAVEGATTKALTEVGFIAADTATFDLNTAKTAVIANTTGDYTTGLPAGYKAATTNHIYRTDGDATFACRVDTSKDTCADLTYIAFAKYLDADGQPQVIFYDAAATVLLKSSYDELVNRWLGR